MIRRRRLSIAMEFDSIGSRVRETAPILLPIDDELQERPTASQKRRMDALNVSSELTRDDDILATALQNNRQHRQEIQKDADSVRSEKRDRMKTTSSVHGVQCQVGFVGDRYVFCKSKCIILAEIVSVIISAHTLTYRKYLANQRHKVCPGWKDKNSESIAF